MKVSENFTLSEFIDKDTYRRFGDSSIWFIDRRVILIAQLLRDRLGLPITINGGQYNLSGFRPPQTKVGAKLSQHRFGRAIDVKIMGEPNKGANILREDIIENFEIYKKVGLTTIEHEDYAPNWCHCDTRWTNQDTLKIVKP